MHPYVCMYVYIYVHTHTYIYIHTYKNEPGKEKNVASTCRRETDRRGECVRRI